MTLQQAAVEAPDPRAVAEALAESDERDLWEDHARAMWLDGWIACLNHFADLIGGRLFPAGVGDLEAKRYGPGGRERFADPRPGDFPGRAA